MTWDLILIETDTGYIMEWEFDSGVDSDYNSFCPNCWKGFDDEKQCPKCGSEQIVRKVQV